MGKNKKFMPKLPTITPKKLISILEKFGFEYSRSKGSHLSYFNPISKRTTIVPFHNSDIPKGTLLNILRQAGISKEELTKLL